VRSLLGRNQVREVFAQRLREVLNYKPSVYKRVYDDSGIIFIHIPKNAGTSISHSLYSGKDPWHFTASDLCRINRKKYLNYSKFAVVRNPWSRLYSAYRYSFQDAIRYRKTPLRFMSNCSSFKSFVMDVLSEDLANRHYFIGQQVNYLTLGGQVDSSIVVGKLENLSSFISELAHKLPMPLDIGFSNTSPPGLPLPEVYTNEMILRVEKLYSRDIRQFGYCFPA